MVVEGVLAIRHGGSYLDAADAARIAQRVWEIARAEIILIDLRETSETTTAALARLILLRSRLLKAGRDLWIVGLRGRAEALYHITRMEKLLPRRRLSRRAWRRLRKTAAKCLPAGSQSPLRGNTAPAAPLWTDRRE